MQLTFLQPFSSFLRQFAQSVFSIPDNPESRRLLTEEGLTFLSFI